MKKGRFVQEKDVQEATLRFCPLLWGLLFKKNPIHIRVVCHENMSSTPCEVKKAAKKTKCDAKWMKPLVFIRIQTQGGFGEAPGVLMFLRWMKGFGGRQMGRWHSGDGSPTPKTVGGGGWWMGETEACEFGSGPGAAGVERGQTFTEGGDKGGVSLIQASRRTREDSCWNRGGEGRGKKTLK